MGEKLGKQGKNLIYGNWKSAFESQWVRVSRNRKVQTSKVPRQLQVQAVWIWVRCYLIETGLGRINRLANSNPQPSNSNTENLPSSPLKTRSLQNHVDPPVPTEEVHSGPTTLLST